MNKRTRLRTLLLAGLGTYAGSEILQMILSPDNLVLVLTISLGSIVLLSLVASAVLKYAGIERAVWIAFAAGCLAPSLKQFVILPIIWFQAPSLPGVLLGALVYMATFWFGDRYFNEWHVKLCYKVALASITIVILGVTAPLLGLYVERAVAAESLLPALQSE